MERDLLDTGHAGFELYRAELWVLRKDAGKVETVIHTYTTASLNTLS